MATLRISNKTYSYKDFLPFLDGSVKVTIDSNAKKDIKNLILTYLKISHQVRLSMVSILVWQVKSNKNRRTRSV